MLEAVRIVERTARALHAAHEAGLVHRDVKPGNIMITPDGSPVVVDFGLVRDEDSDAQTLTRTGELMGTPAYMAPEQVDRDLGREDRRTDVHALGVTLYECLTLERPFESATREQLYRQILKAEPPDPRKRNPRIPVDLKVILQTALEKDRNRRYQTAEAFAEDLRRWREHEPIRAKPIGRVRRVAKWTRRHPAKAVAIAGVALVLLGIGGLLIVERIDRNRAVAGYLREARALAAEKKFAPALERVARARERDAASTAAVELRLRIEKEQAAAADDERKSAAFAAAARAREVAAEKSCQYDAAIDELARKREAIEKLRKVCVDGYAPTAKRAELNRLERELAEREAQAQRLMSEEREALERAARHESPYTGGKASAATEAAFAAFFMMRFRERLAAGDVAGSKREAEEVRRRDKQRRYEMELLGRGTLTVTVEPSDAEVYLFRYEPYETVRTNPDVVSRLVPVPTNGLGRCRPGAWLEAQDFCPGDLFLRITAVENGSLAEKAGLRPGDLVVRLNGQPCGDGMFVGRMHPSGPAAKAGVKLLDRIESVCGEPMEGFFVWRYPLEENEDGENTTVTMVAGGITVKAPRKSRLEVAFRALPGTPAFLVSGKAPAPMTLGCLRCGQPIELRVPAGKDSGIRCEVTAYPLILARENRIDVGTALDADPGSYLLLVRRPGFEDQRFAIVVPRGAAASAKVELLAEATTPPGFVYVPPGPFVYGGDPEAYGAVPRQELRIPGFFLAREELSTSEWLAFVNDPDTQNMLKEEKGPRGRFLPRDSAGRLIPMNSAGIAPVAGVSGSDVQAYLAWRNAKAKKSGEKWRYDMPTEQQWEKAARGVDGRPYPWGDRFDHSLTHGRWRKPGFLHVLGCPGGFEPRDESPFGLLDMAGSRREWTKNLDVADLLIMRGAASDGGVGPRFALMFRSSQRDLYLPSTVEMSYGVRLLARPSESLEEVAASPFVPVRSRR